jgi:valyl-tRNA synthetase
LGERVLLLPGKDHAGIQTQVVYEKKLRAEGIEVEKMSREDFWKGCYDFCIDRSTYMRGQEKLVGTGADFDKEVFTLDPKVSETVYETFVKMYKEGLVYRGTRIVHWSVYSQTSISDVEVEYKEEKGNLWHIKYPLLEAAKRPERRRINLADIGGELIKNNGNHWVILLPGQAELKIGEVVVKKEIVEDIEIERDFVIFRSEKITGSEAKPEQVEKFNEQIREKIRLAGELTVIELVPELDQQDCIVVATTRPETMLGDTAVAVNPADPRYTHLIGKKVRLPVVSREIAIIADDRIDIGFGTGAVKITPAHDFLDYQIGIDHKLEQIQIIDKFGMMTELAGEKYVGMKLLDCRAEIIKDLEESGELLLTEQITHKVPISERGKDVVEPLISAQWFIAVDKEGSSLKKRALHLINSGRIKVYPTRLREMIVQWLENLNDWNVSRQILWGHRMPVWYKNKDSEKEEVFVGMTAPEGHGWEQETDTFDTWFSSGQWPYSTLASLGFLDLENVQASEFFPTHTMVMGRDLLFFWACRMLLLSAYRLNEVPWKNILFTGLVRDSKGQKMSKSKGNGVEPKEVLAKYGADALRAGLIAGSTAGQDVKFDEKKIEAYSKFQNKIWNAAKLVEMKLEGNYSLQLPEYGDLKLASSGWILANLMDNLAEFRKKMDKYEVSSALEIAYHFSWDIFCSWYLEIAKVQLETSNEHAEEIKATMQKAFEGVLQMLHPFMPFFTEEIHQNLGKLGGEKMLAEKKWVAVAGYDAALASTSKVKMQGVLDMITACREVRRILEKPFSEKLTVEADFGLMEQADAAVVNKMANAEIGSIELGIIKPSHSGIIKVAATMEEKDKFKADLQKTLAKKEQELAVLQKILTPGFKAKADADLVAEREGQMAQVSAEVTALKADLILN